MQDTDLHLLQVIQDAIRLSAHILIQNRTQLAGQLLGRLLDYPSSEIPAFLIQVEQGRTTSWLRPLLASLQPPSLLRTLPGHDMPVTCVVLTPDGRQVISASEDTTLKVWDLQSGAQIHTLRGHTASVRAVDATLKVWDLQRGMELRTLKGHTDFVRAVAATPDGQLAISASWDSTIRVWNLERGEAIARFDGDDRLYTCSTAKDRGIIVAGSASGQIIVLRLER